MFKARLQSGIEYRDNGAQQETWLEVRHKKGDGGGLREGGRRGPGNLQTV